MSKETPRILSYKLASVLEPEELDNVSGGSASVTTIGSQRFISTNGGDTTIRFDNYDTM